jgi:hypothetical protein
VSNKSSTSAIEFNLNEAAKEGKNDRKDCHQLVVEIEKRMKSLNGMFTSERCLK